MRRLESRCGEALAVADAVERELQPGEHAFTYLGRTARRRLTVDPAGGARRLLLQQGRFDGYVRLTRDGHELYLNAPALTADWAGRLLEAGRPLLPLATSRVPVAHQTLHRGGWRNRAGQVGLEEVAADPAPLLSRLAEGAGPDHTVQALTVSEVLSEQVYADSAGPRGESVCRGIEVQAVVAAGDGRPAATLSRQAADLERVDAVALGRELALTAAALGPATETPTGHEIDFLPSAAAQLLRALVTTVLFNPITEPRPLCTAVIDDGRAVDGYSARAFDCEGTPTSAMELVTRQGEQRTVATRLNSIAGTVRTAHRLTGHAVWEARRYQPRPAATNVRLAPGGAAPDLWSGERRIVTEVRSLGVEEFRSGGQLAFRLLAVRAVDGTPVGAYAPLVVEGEAAGFLAALTGVGETVSYYPGPFSVGGAPLSMDLSHLSARNEVRS
ncbi:metallopeptidase TldD-related protein [Sphaerimonospora sp. CA-214678]|uniref:metallopeptidase TldD-related protein n=1 Tax=Sphaerimonospora sp. CA-214678 TaxID=3240029 RepID=UPI003D9238C4